MGGPLGTPQDKESLKTATIYTDGACLGNPGPGGYGVVLIYGDRRKELSGGYRLTTNNRMELMAAIVGLGDLKARCAVTLFTDSQYLADAVNQGWATRWRANGWMRNRKEKAVNADLWGQLLDLCAQHEVAFRWVRGHAGDPDNERCDQLSVAAAQQADLPIDAGYENKDNPPPTLL
jgi:ribonuclease HI